MKIQKKFNKPLCKYTIKKSANKRGVELKLLFCTDCKDIIKLDTIIRKCKCRKISGRLNKENIGIYSGSSAVPLLIHKEDIGNLIVKKEKEKGFNKIKV